MIFKDVGTGGGARVRVFGKWWAVATTVVLVGGCGSPQPPAVAPTFDVPPALTKLYDLSAFFLKPCDLVPPAVSQRVGFDGKPHFHYSEPDRADCTWEGGQGVRLVLTLFDGVDRVAEEFGQPGRWLYLVAAEVRGQPAVVASHENDPPATGCSVVVRVAERQSVQAELSVYPADPTFPVCAKARVVAESVVEQLGS
ncbi:DUF3558 family protein [Actinokineospora terrae]|uniref:DUF3558 domain-containing protein n=1 Tax=Actinokineospora terrae TaxID=155974 RepID=A0A1H9XP95_9PSEU|nr:DUF3558 family protein [Actinokineospora terrae]SES47976.1 Protein of unknown function [Actinokineospora terrae]